MGVSKKVFNIVYRGIEESISKPSKSTKRTKFAAVLMCLKLGNSYAAISALFDIDQTTLSRWFDEVIYATSSLSEAAIVWWDRDKVQARMPKQCRYKLYCN